MKKQPQNKATKIKLNECNRNKLRIKLPLILQIKKLDHIWLYDCTMIEHALKKLKHNVIIIGENTLVNTAN